MTDGAKLWGGFGLEFRVVGEWRVEGVKCCMAVLRVFGFGRNGKSQFIRWFYRDRLNKIIYNIYGTANITYTQLYFTTCSDFFD